MNISQITSIAFHKLFRLNAVTCCLFFFLGLTTDLYASERKYALGASWISNTKTINLTNSYEQHSPEIFAYAYYFVLPSMALRPGIRLNYSWMQQPSNVSNSLHINEYDLKSTAEVSLLATNSDWNYAFTFGGGTIFRFTSLNIQDPILPSDHSISGTSSLPYIQGQLSVTYSLAQSLLEVGPFARYSHIFSDYRITWLLGIEVSIGWFDETQQQSKRR